MPEPTLTRENSEWFLRRAAEDPEFLRGRYLPALERLVEKKHLELHQAIKSQGLSEIKLAQGLLDGVQEALGLINGMRLSDARPPAAHGLIGRMFGKGESHV